MPKNVIRTETEFHGFINSNKLMVLSLSLKCVVFNRKSQIILSYFTVQTFQLHFVKFYLLKLFRGVPVVTMIIRKRFFCPQNSELSTRFFWNSLLFKVTFVIEYLPGKFSWYTKVQNQGTKREG